MEQFVAWLAQLSPRTVYLVLGLCTFLENIFPPIPSDVAVALGGFLSQRTAVSPIGVWLVGWVANFGGTILLYLGARRYGRRFLATPLGQRLLPGDAIVAMEREYLRLGVGGIFLARLLPGFRSFVAPFVGLVALSPGRALLPIAVASCLWYGFLTWAGVRLGAEWEAISQFIGHLNRSLAIVAALVCIAIGFIVWRRARAQGPRRRQLLRIIRTALGDLRPGDRVSASGVDAAAEGAAALLHELTHADPAFTVGERDAIADFLRERWGLRRDVHHAATSLGPAMADTQEMTTILTEQYGQPQRTALAESLYRIALSDGTLSQHEARLMLRIGVLLGLSGGDLAEARRRAAL